MSYPELPPLSGMRRSEDFFVFPTDINSLTDHVRRHIPGLTTSAAFFSSLRHNLHLHDAPFHPSPLSTPRLNPRTSLDVLPRQPSPLPLASIVLSNHPVALASQTVDSPAAPLTIPATGPTSVQGHDVAQDEKPSPNVPNQTSEDVPVSIACISSSSNPDHADARAAALQLLKHSLARDQTLLALRSLATHPLNIALAALLLVVVRVLVPRTAPLSLLCAIYAWLAAALVLAAAVGVYWPLRCAAVDITDALAAGSDDEILIARWTKPAAKTSHADAARTEDADSDSDSDADANSNSNANADEQDQGPIIGVLILATRTTLSHPAASSASNPRSARSNGHHHRRQAHNRGSSASSGLRVRGSIRAWAVQPGYRGRGVGEALLRAAYAGVARRSAPGGDGGDLGVACGHVFAHQVLRPLGDGAAVRGLARVLGTPGGLYGRLAEQRERGVKEMVRGVVDRVREERAAEGRGRRYSGGKK